MKFRKLQPCVASLVAFVGLVAAWPAIAADRPASITVYAAASLVDALQEVAADFTRATGIEVRSSFASSALLARQIEAGAGADLYLSADRQWMDYLHTRGVLQSDTRVDLLGNRLVLIAPADTRSAVDLSQPRTLERALGSSRLALGDPETVPAGRYARAALQSLGLWRSVSSRIAYADNVRSALAFVARGEAALGIVYATDARVEPRVRIVAEFAADSYPPVTYPVALTRSAAPAAARLLLYLRQDAAAKVFRRYGFEVIRPIGKVGASSGAARPSSAQARHKLDEITGSAIVAAD
ncbi:MAG TPA: molybdate ABC transporter substrate-binding protein [Steroidobacteraceae bacterium]|nr:molybdate ABC transporter substrate-binding protein [Steroidobacteraceae bacterium]HRX88735.1 molybdate ABC transporter substrate-binding protein [Steroidobacteraceae bacterium]